MAHTLFIAPFGAEDNIPFIRDATNKQGPFSKAKESRTSFFFIPSKIAYTFIWEAL